MAKKKLTPTETKAAIDLAAYEPKDGVARVSDLKFDPDNARTHAGKNLDAIEASLRQWGQIERLIIQRGTGIVIGGNGRLTVIRQRLKWDTVKITEVKVNEAERKALGVALNRTSELAAWDEKKLAEILAEAQTADLGAGTGFNDGDLEALIEASVQYDKINNGGNADYDLAKFDQEPIDASAKRVAEKIAKGKEDKEIADDEEADETEEDEEEVKKCPHCGKPLR